MLTLLFDVVWISLIGLNCTEGPSSMSTELLIESLCPIFRIEVVFTECLSTDLECFPGVLGLSGVGLKVRSFLPGSIAVSIPLVDWSSFDLYALIYVVLLAVYA